MQVSQMGNLNEAGCQRGWQREESSAEIWKRSSCTSARNERLSSPKGRSHSCPRTLEPFCARFVHKTKSKQQKALLKPQELPAARGAQHAAQPPAQPRVLSGPGQHVGTRDKRQRLHPMAVWIAAAWTEEALFASISICKKKRKPWQPMCSR